MTWHDEHFGLVLLCVPICFRLPFSCLGSQQPLCSHSPKPPTFSIVSPTPGFSNLPVLSKPHIFHISPDPAQISALPWCPIEAQKSVCGCSLGAMTQPCAIASVLIHCAALPLHCHCTFALHLLVWFSWWFLGRVYILFLVPGHSRQNQKSEIRIIPQCWCTSKKR